MNLQKITALSLASMLAMPLIGEEKVDLAAIHKIKYEAFQNSKVMETMFWLTDANGHRLAGSPGYKKAGDWAVTRMKEFGLSNVKTEKWGPFGKGWNYTHYEGHMIEPSYSPLIGFPLAWTAGTNGTVSGEPILTTLANDADLAKWKGKLKDKIILTEALKDQAMIMAAPAKRWTDAELANEAMAPDPGLSRGPRGGGPPPAGGRPARAGAPGAPGAPADPMAAFASLRQFRTKLQKFLAEEGPAVILQPGSGNSTGGTVFGSGGGGREAKDAVVPCTIALTPEHYNRIVRLIDHKVPVKLEFNVKAEFTEPADSFNVIGEIPGTGKHKDEVVMIGAHLDSWHGGTGATDNAAGSSVMLEAMRILKDSGLKLDRTVRIGLWGGEEEGLLGSKAYVREHFADTRTMKTTEQHEKFAGYFNIDNGTGKIRGIYLQGNDMVQPIFEAWLAPFKDLGATTTTIRDTGGTDHQSFDGVGLPGFQFIQDEVEYNQRTHHSNMDVYDRIQKGDMMQISAIVASFVYNTANRDEKLPRKPLPKPTPDRNFGDPPPATPATGGGTAPAN
jgi:hypothetical protein